MMVWLTFASMAWLFVGLAVVVRITEEEAVRILFLFFGVLLWPLAIVIDFFTTRRP